MPTIDRGHWNGRRNRLPHLAGSIVWRSRWGRRFRLPVEADFHRSSKSRKRLCTHSKVTLETVNVQTGAQEFGRFLSLSSVRRIGREERTAIRAKIRGVKTIPIPNARNQKPTKDPHNATAVERGK